MKNRKGLWKFFTLKNISSDSARAKGRIDSKMLVQAQCYLDNEMRENTEKKLKGILIGKYISKTLKNEIGKSSYQFEIKLLDIDIPTNIKICDKCRRANALSDLLCRYCGSRKFIIDPFLFHQ